MKRSFGVQGCWAWALALLLIPLQGPLGAQNPGEFQSTWTRVSAELRDTLEASGMVGSSWAFLEGGRVLAQETFGFADLESGRLVDESTIFHWGSITKTLTGIAILQLRDRGLLTLDDPILRYVPELARVHNPFGPMEGITLRHLLSHSSGFRNGTWPWGGGEEWHPHEPTRWEQLVAMMPYTEILFPPGSRYSYSNPGIVFLGQVIERLSGEEWEVYVEKNILRPLDMHRSYFDYTPYHLLPYRSNNYSVTGGVPTANGLDFDTGITVSNGGLNAPLGDMALYLAFLTDAGTLEQKARYDQVLGRASLEEMWVEEVPVGDTGSPEGGHGALLLPGTLRRGAVRGPHREPESLPGFLLHPSGNQDSGHRRLQQHRRFGQRPSPPRHPTDSESASRNLVRRGISPLSVTDPKEPSRPWGRP